MSEQEYLEMIVAERIQMILADMEAGAVMDGEEEWEKTLDGLEEAQRKAIRRVPGPDGIPAGGNRKAFVSCRPERWDPSAGLGPVRLNDGTGKQRGIPCGPILFTCGKEKEKPE